MSGTVDSGSLLSVRDLRVEFRIAHKRPFEAVRGVSIEVPKNRTVALVGESGSGKSVTAMSILRLLPDNAHVSGTILFDGTDLLLESESAMRARRGRDISVIFQEPMTSLNPVFTVGNQIAEVLRIHEHLRGKVLKERVLALMDEVGIPDPRARVMSFPHELSGGQQQRVMIAMALACNPRLLIADEPTTALDVTIQKQILELLARLQRSYQMSVLFITHDLGVVGDIADDVVVMQHGEIKEQGSVEQVFEAPVHPYTKALLACRPRMDYRPLRLPVVADFMRSPTHTADAPPSGERVERTLRSAGETILEVKGLSKTFRLRGDGGGSRLVHAVKDVSFNLRRGTTLGLVGESGSGKTTVGLTLLRLHEASAGEVWFHEGDKRSDLFALSPREMLAYRRRMQIIFQNPYASLNPRFSIGDILVEPMRIHHIGDNEADRLARAVKLLDRVSLPRASLYKYPHEFSGGQRQRIAIARCLTLNPEVLICDESVSALDVSVQAQVLNLLLDLQDEFGLSYVFISHDLAVVNYISDEVMVMNAGEVVEHAGADAIYAAPQHPYTQKLLASIPRGRTRSRVSVDAPTVAA